MFHQGVRHVKDLQCWAEWWILWRRVAAGLTQPHHEEIASRVTPFLLPSKGGSAPKKGGRPRPESHEMAEIWRCRGQPRTAWARVEDVARPGARQGVIEAKPGASRALVSGPAGARTPLYGPANTTVPKEMAERWVDAVLGRTYAEGRETADAVFTLSQLARVSGDRSRDVDPDLRLRVIDRLRALGADQEAIRPVIEYTEREALEQGQALGDALPVGLRLIGRRP